MASPEEVAIGGFQALAVVGRSGTTGADLLVPGYKDRDQKAPPLNVIGKPVSFVSGGYFLKDHKAMARMKGDTAGGGRVGPGWACPSIWSLSCPWRKTTSGRKPCAPAMTPAGQSVDFTDAEGRLMLAYAISCSVATCAPLADLDVATLTYDTEAGLGPTYTPLAC